MSFLESLPKPFLVLAPMDDVTDTVFRRVVASCTPPDLYITEFVNVDGLQSPGRDKLLKKLQHTDEEHPIVAQLWGKIPENYYKTAREIADGVFGEFDGVDINMGCPDKTIMKNGCCAALIDNRELALQIIDAVKRGVDGKLPVSVKTRLGNKEIDLSWPSLLLEQKLNMLSIHGRTAKEMSSVPAHWDQINEVRKLRDQLAPGTLIVGNGDVQSRSQALELAKKYDLDGVMIGRGVLNDPYAFAEHSPWENLSKSERIALFRRHIELFAETWKNDERKIHTLNKFCKLYINGFDGAKELRDQLMNANSTAELLEILAV